MDHAKRKNENHEAEHANDSSSNRYKKAKQAIDSSADELVCPLTLELPIDPVMAEDAKVYERTAIEEHIEKNHSDLRSPITNEPMGKRLLPALQVRNVIEQLVGSGAIDGDKAARWKEELYKRKVVRALRQKAESGDTDAMCRLARRYSQGTGVKQDKSMMYSWYKKAAEGGNVKGMAMAGQHLMFGSGVDKNMILGMVHLGRAEASGSDVAAFWLGKWFITGAFGLPMDNVQGKNFLRNVVHRTCKFKHLAKPYCEEASNLLGELDDLAVISPEPS